MSGSSTSSMNGNVNSDGGKGIDGRVALVTGAAQGLGEAIARHLAAEGFAVAVADLDADGAGRVAGEISGKTGRPTMGIGVDVTDEAEVTVMIERTVAGLGGLDLLVSNAGILIAGPVEEFAAEQWQAVMNVNLFGYFLSAKAAAQIMIEQGSGVIIQVNSKSGKKGSYRNSAYAASKFGGIGLTQSLALELAEHGIRVNAVCPGNLLDSPLWTDSLYGQYAERWGITEAEVRQQYIDQVPLKRGCAYEDVCRVITFLASDGAAYMTGQAVNVTGGQEMR